MRQAPNWNLMDNLFEFDRAESSGQIIFRKIFESFIVLGTMYLAWTWGQYTLRISDIVLPLGLARYVDISFMHGNTLPLWNAGLISVLVLLGWARLGRWPYAIAFVLLIIQYAARFTLGEIPHSSNLVGMGLLGFACGQLFYPDETSRSRFGLGFTYFFLGLAYTSAAISKLVASGITWSDGRHLWMWINEKAVDEIARSGFVELNFVQELALSLATYSYPVFSFWPDSRTVFMVSLVQAHSNVGYAGHFGTTRGHLADYGHSVHPFGLRIDHLGLSLG